MTQPTVVLTGATGFVGKVVLERLVRMRRDLGIEKIFALVRARTPQQARRRVESEIVASECFRLLPEGWQEILEPVAADLERPGAGLDETARRRLVRDGTHWIHCAASIEFDLPLREALDINTSGSLEVLSLAREAERLESFVVVSTAYVAPPGVADAALREELAPLPRSAEEIYEEIRTGSVDKEAILAECRHPNTYTLTKCLAEHLLLARADGLPVRIVRPSIISACIESPFPGWIDSHAAFAGFVAMLATGQLRAVSADPATPLDVVPCDVVAERIVTTCFEPRRPDEPAAWIRHAVAGPRRGCPISLCRTEIRRFFDVHRVGLGPRIRFVGKRGPAFHLADAFLHRIPARLSATWYRVRGDPKRAAGALRQLERVRALNREFRPFTHTRFRFVSASESPVDWEPEAFLATICGGVYRHLLRQRDDEVPLTGRDEAQSPWSAMRRARGSFPSAVLAVLIASLVSRIAALVSFDQRGFREAVATLESGRRPVVVLARGSWLDPILVWLLCRLRPDLGLRRPVLLSRRAVGWRALLARLGPVLPPSNRAIRRALRRGATPICCLDDAPLASHAAGSLCTAPGALRRAGALMDLLQAAAELDPPAVLPVGVFWDRRPDPRGFGSTRRGARRPAGRVHLYAAPPLQAPREPDARTLLTEVAAALGKAQPTSSYHLRGTVAHLPGVSTSGLGRLLAMRGVHVLRSPLRETPTPEAAARYREAWLPHLLDAVVASCERPELIDALRPELTDALRPELTDGRPAERASGSSPPPEPELEDAARRIGAQLEKDWARALSSLGRPPGALRARNAEELARSASPVPPRFCELVFDWLVRRDVLRVDDDGAGWGARCGDLKSLLERSSPPAAERAS